MSTSPTDKNWSKRKFAQLPLAERHKRTAAHLTDLYIEMCACLDQPPLPTDNPEQVANAYHTHLAGRTPKEHDLLPRIRTGDRPLSTPPLPVAIYLDNIRSAHNVGSIIRTAEAFALGPLIYGGLTPTPDHSQVLKTAMGAQLPHLPQPPGPLIALETSPDATPLHDFTFPSSFTLILGNEEYGISQELLARADHLIEIPLYGRKNSLNVANAFAIVAATIRRHFSR